MRYWQSYRYVFRNPNWPMNLLLGSVCLFIPWIGQVVLIGYLFEVIDFLLRRHPVERGGTSSDSADDAFSEQIRDALPADDQLDLAHYPDFTFNRFSAYLVRGVWPFLVRLIVGMAVGVLAGLALVVGLMLAGFAAASADSPVLFFVIYGLFWILYAFVMFAVAILTAPIYVRAGLSGDLAGAFSMAFYRDFMKRVGKETVLAELFLTVSGVPFYLLGLLFCFVGMYPAWALISCAQHHIEYQLYELYLERGGAPVPRKESQPARLDRYTEKKTPSSHVMRPQAEERSTDVMRPDEDR